MEQIDYDDYVVVNVAPSVVPTYQPSIRVFSYNVTNWGVGTATTATEVDNEDDEDESEDEESVQGDNSGDEDENEDELGRATGRKHGHRFEHFHERLMRDALAELMTVQASAGHARLHQEEES